MSVAAVGLSPRVSFCVTPWRLGFPFVSPLSPLSHLRKDASGTEANLSRRLVVLGPVHFRFLRLALRSCGRSPDSQRPAQIMRLWSFLTLGHPPNMGSDRLRVDHCRLPNTRNRATSGPMRPFRRTNSLFGASFLRHSP